MQPDEVRILKSYLKAALTPRYVRQNRTPLAGSDVAVPHEITPSAKLPKPSKSHVLKLIATHAGCFR